LEDILEEIEDKEKEGENIDSEAREAWKKPRKAFTDKK
jgi:hypothetical protein